MIIYRCLNCSETCACSGVPRKCMSCGACRAFLKEIKRCSGSRKPQ